MGADPRGPFRRLLPGCDHSRDRGSCVGPGVPRSTVPAPGESGAASTARADEDRATAWRASSPRLGRIVAPRGVVSYRPRTRAGAVFAASPRLGRDLHSVRPGGAVGVALSGAVAFRQLQET